MAPDYVLGSNLKKSKIIKYKGTSNVKKKKKKYTPHAMCTLTLSHGVGLTPRERVSMHIVCSVCFLYIPKGTANEC
jgi:hypothetical protein